MTATPDPIAFELFKNALFSIADEMALTIFRTTYSGVLKDNMDYEPTGTLSNAEAPLAVGWLHTNRRPTHPL